MRLRIQHRYRSFLRVGSVSCILTLGGGAAHGQDIAAAETLFNRGLADMNAERYETGCKALAESQRIDPRLGTLFTLATCESRWGRVATAYTRFGDYLAQYERLSDELKRKQGERPKVAKAEREKLEPQIPQLALLLPPGAPPGTVVTRNGEVLSEASLGGSLPVDPGEHVVSTQAPGGPMWEQRFTLQKAEKKELTLEVKPAAPPKKPETMPDGPRPAVIVDSSPTWRMPALIAGSSAAAAGLLVGGLFLGLSFDKAAAKEQAAKDPSGREAMANAAGDEATFKNVMVWGFVGAGAALAGTAAVYFLTRTSPGSTVKGAVGLGVRGPAASIEWQF
jgi:hypothetical protein